MQAGVPLAPEDPGRRRSEGSCTTRCQENRGSRHTWRPPQDPHSIPSARRQSQQSVVPFSQRPSWNPQTAGNNLPGRQESAERHSTPECFPTRSRTHPRNPACRLTRRRLRNPPTQPAAKHKSDLVRSIRPHPLFQTFAPLPQGQWRRNPFSGRAHCKTLRFFALLSCLVYCIIVKQ